MKTLSSSDSLNPESIDRRYLRMWPRSVLISHFVPRKNREKPYSARLKNLRLLDCPGVYVLHAQDESVYYIGRTKKPGVGLGERILTHVKPNSRYPRWTYFSAFLIKDAQVREKIESILISAVPTARNAARPMKAYKLPTQAYPDVD